MKCDSHGERSRIRVLEARKTRSYGASTGNLAMGTLEAGNSGGNRSFGHKCFQNRVVLGGSQCRRAKSLDVERKGGTHVGHSLLIGVALSDHRATRQPERIS